MRGDRLLRVALEEEPGPQRLEGAVGTAPGLQGGRVERVRERGWKREGVEEGERERERGGDRRECF